MIDIEKAKRDFEYFYNEVVILEDKDGNPMKKPELTNAQREFIKWIKECEVKGARAFYIPNCRFKFR